MKAKLLYSKFYFIWGTSDKLLKDVAGLTINNANNIIKATDRPYCITVVIIYRFYECPSTM